MDTESFTILLSLSCTTSHPWVSLNASRADQCGAGRNRTKGLTSTHRTSRGDTPSAPTSHYLLTPTHTNTNTTHTENFSWCLYSLPPCIYTLKGMESLIVTSYSSLSLDHSHFSCYLSHAPRRPLYPCLSRIRNTHTYLSRPRQMHQLHIHTCYITYPIDLKSPLFTFISHTTFLLNKVWPKNYFRVSTYIQHYKVIWRSTNANLHCMVPTMIFIPHCEFVYFYTIYKVSHNKEKRRASLSPSHTPLYAPFTYAHKTISRSSKSKPPENSRMFHLSLAIYAMTIIVFEAKARYVHWTSESTHYGHHLRLVVIIQSRAHRTTLYLLMT